MARPDEFRELLFADVALLKGHAAARQVAAALLKYWDRRERTDTTLDEELAKIAGLTKEQLTDLVKLCKERGSILVFDAAYAPFIRSPNVPKSIFEIGILSASRENEYPKYLNSWIVRISCSWTETALIPGHFE